MALGAVEIGLSNRSDLRHYGLFCRGAGLSRRLLEFMEQSGQRASSNLVGATKASSEVIHESDAAC